MSAGSTTISVTTATQARLVETARELQPSVRLLRLPLLIMDGDCTDPAGLAGGPDDEPPAKRSKTKIVPYKLKDSDKKMVYDSGTVIYTEEFKRTVWDYLLKHSLADGEARYPEISHSVLYKWRRKAHEERGSFKPQRKSLMADLKKERDKDDNDSSNDKDRRYSEPPKVPKLKISLKLTTKEEKESKEQKEPRVKQITALSDDLTIEKKIKVVIFALQNSTQKAAEHFNMRAGDVHSFMSQNVIRRMALDRIRKKVTKGSRTGDSGGKTREEIEEIVNLARRTSVERAARQFGVREGQLLQWMRMGPAALSSANQQPVGSGDSNAAHALNRVANGGANEEDDENSEYLDFMLKVIDTARKQTLSRASKMFRISPEQVLVWMRQFFTEDEVRRVKNSDEDLTASEHKTDHKVDLREFIRGQPITSDDLEKMLYERLQEPSSRIRVIDTGEMAIEKVVAILKVALTDGRKIASAQFNIPRTTVSTWISRNGLEELVADGVANSRTTSAFNSSASNSRARRGEAGSSLDLHKLPNGNSNGTLHSLSRSPFKNDRRSASPPANGVLTTMGDQLESMEDDVPLAAHRPSLNGDSSNQPDPNNNNCSPSKDANGNLVNGVAKTKDVKTLSLSLEQIEAARELGITMRCLSRWLECRDHFAKLWSGRMAFAAGDSLRELLSFRVEAIDYAQREGRLYAASVFRVTLSELHEWNGRRESYVRFLSRKEGADPRALAMVDASSELLFRESEELARAQAIAHRVGIDLVQAHRFIQQLYLSSGTASSTSTQEL